MTDCVLVTGASGGIGAALADAFAAEGMPMVLVARSNGGLHKHAQQLHDDHGLIAHVCRADLGDPASTAAIVDFLAANDLTVRVLVNNAGHGLMGAFADLDAEGQLNIIDVNIRALTALTRALLPAMIADGRGGILNVASTAAFMPGPYMTVYYATKAYVLSFSEGLSAELDGTGVTVTALCPGPVTTGFQARADMENAPLLKMMKPATADDVAQYGYRAFKRGKRVAVHGFQNKISATLIPLLPRALVLPVIKRLQKT